MDERDGKRLAELLGTLASQEGLSPSLLPDVHFFKAVRAEPRSPVVYDPIIVIVGQGRKRGYLGDRVYDYDANNYLVLSVPLPFECEIDASPQEPLLAVNIRVDSAVLGDLLVEIGEDSPIARTIPRGIHAMPLTSALSGAVIRLLECLLSTIDGRILGPQIVREILYRVLCGEYGGAMRALVLRHGNFGRIARVLRQIHAEYARSFDVESLAREANMSVSAFHHNFKAITCTTPLQYLKSIRLHKARMLMAQDGLSATSAARRVGYESVPQFCREFKRLFGAKPIDEAMRMRLMIGG